MRFKTFTFLLLVTIYLCAQGLFAQKHEQALMKDAGTILKERGEVYFSFKVKDINDLKLLMNNISIDEINGTTIKAYANKDQFEYFESFAYEYNLLTPPSMTFKPKIKTGVSLKEIQVWDFYPSYDAYLDLMQQFSDEYPELCQTYNFGYSEEGRELLMVKISDNVDEDENEPEFLYTATMHGDELAGYVLSMHLADYLLSNYGSDPDITELVDNTEIHINPLANPDGTYAGGNGSVWGATRYNANGVDLNRNYPDPEDGPHPDGNEWQAETLAFMQLAEDHDFVLSSNWHGGAEVCNYPWDTWPRLHADDSWWYFVCREYADTVHQYAPTGYMDGFDNGVTNGYQWYTTNGNRQDYMNYFHQCREFTLELSSQKMLPENDLLDHWDYNYRSFINYIEQSLYGIRGTITDATTGQPIKALVEVINHEQDSSMVFSSLPEGNYHRPIYEGTWDLRFSAPGYYPQIIEDIAVSKYNATIADVALEPGNLIADFTASNTMASLGESIDFTDESYGDPVEWQWTFEGGTPQTSTEQNPTDIVYNSIGTYDVSLFITNAEGDTSSITKTDYISVNAEYPMSNTTVSTCTGIFYDSGAGTADYSNNEDFIMTFNPGTPGGKIKMNFIEFDVEYSSTCDYDYLNIYDGPTTNSPLIGTYCGTSSPGIIEATNDEGALTFKFHSDFSVTKPGWAAEIECIGGGLVTQTISLDPFYQFVSSHIEAENPDMMVINEDLLDQELNFIRNSDGNMLSKIGPNWVNNIGSWVSTQGYLYHMNESADLQVEGEITNPQNPITLEQGYQFIAYLPDVPMNAMDAFESIIGDNLNFVRNSDGYMLKKVGPNWVNGIGNTYPGEGYLVRMNADDELIYPVAQKRSLASMKVREPVYFNEVHGNPAKSVYTLYVDNFNLKTGDEIGIYCDERLVGSARISKPGKDYTEVPVFSELSGEKGFNTGSPIVIKIWNREINEVVEIEPSFINPYGDAHISSRFPAEDGNYSILKSGIANDHSDNTLKVYPNPVNAKATLTYEIKQAGETTLSIHDMTGRLIKDFNNIPSNKGFHKTELDCSGIPAGIYYLRMESHNALNKNLRTQKIVINKNN